MRSVLLGTVIHSSCRAYYFPESFSKHVRFVPPVQMWHLSSLVLFLTFPLIPPRTWRCVPGRAVAWFPTILPPARILLRAEGFEGPAMAQQAAPTCAKLCLGSHPALQSLVSWVGLNIRIWKVLFLPPKIISVVCLSVPTAMGGAADAGI